jgi:hypothetical protein
VEVDGVELLSQVINYLFVAFKIPKLLHQMELDYHLVDMLKVAHRQRPQSAPLCALYVYLEGDVLLVELAGVDDVSEGVVGAVLAREVL